MQAQKTTGPSTLAKIIANEMAKPSSLEKFAAAVEDGKKTKNVGVLTAFDSAPAVQERIENSPFARYIDGSLAKNEKETFENLLDGAKDHKEMQGPGGTRSWMVKETLGKLTEKAFERMLSGVINDAAKSDLPKEIADSVQASREKLRDFDFQKSAQKLVTALGVNASPADIQHIAEALAGDAARTLDAFSALAANIDHVKPGPYFQALINTRKESLERLENMSAAIDQASRSTR